MKRVEKPLAEVRRWKKMISQKTLKMTPSEAVKYFNDVYLDPMVARILKRA